MATSLEDKLIKENAELRCYVERLRSTLVLIKRNALDFENVGVYLASIIVPCEEVLQETPAQSLAAHDADIADRVRVNLTALIVASKEEISNDGINEVLDKVTLLEAIRNMTKDDLLRDRGSAEGAGSC